MKYIYKNEKFALIKKSRNDAKEVVYSYEVNGTPLKKFYFVNVNNNSEAIKKAEALLKTEKSNGTLDKYTKKYLRMMKGGHINKKILWIAGGIVVVAGLAVGATFLTLKLMGNNNWKSIDEEKAASIIKNIDDAQGNYKDGKYKDQTKLFEIVEKLGHTGTYTEEQEDNLPDNKRDEKETDETHFDINKDKKIIYFDEPDMIKDKEESADGIRYLMFREDDNVPKPGVYSFFVKEGDKDPLPEESQGTPGDFDSCYSAFQEFCYSQDGYVDYIFGHQQLEFETINNDPSTDFSPFGLVALFSVDKETSKKAIESLKQFFSCDKIDYNLTSSNEESISLVLKAKNVNIPLKYENEASITGDGVIEIVFVNSILQKLAISIKDDGKVVLSALQGTTFGKIKKPDYTKWEYKGK